MKHRGPRVQSTTGNLSSATVDQVFAAFGTNNDTETSEPPVDPILLNIFKLLSKRDSQTRMRSLSELLVNIQSKHESHEVVGIISLFMESYVRGALLDPNWKCRSLYHRCLIEIFNKVGGRALESHLPRVIPILLLSQYDDSNHEITQAATDLFQRMFSSHEKQLRVIDHFKSNVMQFLEQNLAATPVSLSRQFRPSAAGATTPDDEFESTERYERVIRCCIKCIVAHFPQFPSGPIIALLSPSTSPIIQTEVIRFVIAFPSLVNEIPETHISFLVSEVALVSSSSVKFFQDTVWSLIKILPKNVFENKSLLLKLINYLKLTDCRSWNSIMMSTLPRLVKKNSEIIGIVFQKISESMVLRNANLFNTLCRFILKLDDSIVEKLIHLACEDNAMKFALVTAIQSEKVIVRSDDDPVFELLLVSADSSRESSDKTITNLVHSISRMSDLKFLIEKCQKNEKIMKSISSHPRILSSDWINDREEFIPFLDSLLCSGWSFIKDQYNTTIARALPFDYLVELVTESSGSWVSQARAPAMKNPVEFVNEIIENPEFSDLFKTAIEFDNRQIIDNFRDNGIFAFGNSDFNKVIEQLILFSDLTDFLLETNSVSSSVGISAFKRVCSDKNLPITIALCKVVKTVCIASDEVIPTWCHAAYLEADDQFVAVCLEDICEVEKCEDLIVEFLQNHKFALKKFPKISFFKNNYELLAIWIVRKINQIYSQTEWNEFLGDLKMIDNWSFVMDQLISIFGSLESVSWPIFLDCLDFVRSRVQQKSTEWVELIVGKSEVPVSIRLCAMVVLNGLQNFELNSLKIEDDLSKMIVSVVSGDSHDTDFENFLSLASNAGIRRYAEKLLALTFPTRSEFLDFFYHVDDDKVTELFVCSDDVKACEEAADRFVHKVGTPWRIAPQLTSFLVEKSSVLWAIQSLTTPLNRVGESRLVSDKIELVDLISVAQFRSTLRTLLAGNEEICVRNLMNSLILKFMKNSDSLDFMSLFELSESLGGDEEGELRGIFMVLLFDIAAELVAETAKKRSGTPPLVTADVCETFINWAQCLSPGEFHDWVSRGDAPANLSDALIRSGVSSLLIDRSLANKYTNPSLKQSYSKSSKLLVCRYTTCGGEITAELSASFPDAWPARLATIEVSPVAGLSKAKNARLKISIQQIFRSNGVQQAVQIWIENIEGFLANVEECYICYSVTYHHGTKGTGSGTGSGGAIPDKECRNCHYKFHAQCLLKWFKQSQKTNCVLCQQPF